MSISKRRITAVSAAALLAAGAMASTAAAGRAQPAGGAVAATSQSQGSEYCWNRGVATAGIRVGPGPSFEWRWSNQEPYLGASYNWCKDTLYITYGGMLRGWTHYNVRGFEPYGRQIELRLASIAFEQVQRPNLSGTSVSIQACSRGGLFESSRCTRWSPAVSVSGRSR